MRILFVLNQPTKTVSNVTNIQIIASERKSGKNRISKKKIESAQLPARASKLPVNPAKRPR